MLSRAIRRSTGMPVRSRSVCRAAMLANHFHSRMPTIKAVSQRLHRRPTAAWFSDAPGVKTSDSVAAGDKVSIHYTGTLDDGETFDSSRKREPLTFKMGGGQMIAGMDNNIRGMQVGETKTFTLSTAEAYGEYKQEAVVAVPLDKLPGGVTAGAKLQGGNGQPALVVSVDEEKKEAQVDMNHPLAGKALTFEVEVVKRIPKGEGVKIETLTEGDGKTFPKAGDTLTMHYTGTLASDGKQFDSSRAEGKEPFKFTIGVGQVIEGWDEGVMAMSLGQRANLHISADMGYGERGAGGDIPPNADLVFDVELLNIEEHVHGPSCNH